MDWCKLMMVVPQLASAAGYAGSVVLALLAGVGLGLYGKKRRAAVPARLTDAADSASRQTVFLSALLESIPDLVFFKDLDGRYLGCSPSLSEFVGRPRDSIVGYTDYDLFEQAVADAIRASDRLVLENGVARHNDEWVEYADGRRALVDTFKAPLKTRDGEVIGLLGISRDITECQQAERELALRETYLSAIIENLPGLVWLKDQDSRFLAGNKTLAVSVGMQQGCELKGMSDDEIFPADLADRYRGDDLAVMQSRTPVRMEEQIPAEGGTRWFETFKTPVVDLEGQVLGTVGYAQDITPRKQTEARIQRMSEIQRELMRLATDFVNVPVARQDEAIHQALSVIGKLIGADRAYLFRYDFDHGLMSNTHEWCSAGIAPEIENLQQISIDLVPDWVHAHVNGSLIHIPVATELPAGSSIRKILEPRRVKSLITLPLMNECHCLGFVGFDAVTLCRVWQEEEVGLLRVMAEMFANFEIKREAEIQLSQFSREQTVLISQLTKLQKDLVLACEESQSAARAKSMFLANMSHEIRTPLNAILGYIQILRRSCPSREANATCSRALGIMLDSGQHLQELINDILVLSRNESRRILLNHNEFDFRGMLTEVQHLFINDPRADRISIGLEYDEAIPGCICTDRGKVRQVLINLVSNAVKFTHEGRIRISARLQESGEGPADLLPNSVGIAVTVEDTGEGIPEDHLDRIFSAFEQASAGRRAGEGTGLGLSICRQYARALDGDVAVASTVGTGSCFTFTFRARSCKVVEAEESRRIQSLVKMDTPPRLLVVEDDEHSRQMLCVMLETVGYRVESAGDGIGALEILVADPAFDAILLDKKMPRMDGLESLAKIRTTPALRSIPVLMLTASAYPDDAEILVTMGAAAFISKPVEEERVLKELGRVLEVEYVYIDKATPVRKPPFEEKDAVECLGDVVSELLEDLRTHLGRGHVRGLYAVIGRLAAQQPDLAGYLRQLVEAYDYDALYRILKMEKENP